MNPPAQAAAAWLEWYGLCGVEDAVAPEPQPRKAPPAPAAQTSAAAPAPPQPAAPAQSPRAAARQSHELAQSAADLAGLHAIIRNFDGCALKRTATNTVICDGNPNAPLMLIGEAPGSEEDAKGIPFCGPSGRLLDKMLAGIGIRGRQDYFITNMLYWRPPGNRKPSTEETAICLPFVWRHIELLKPKLIVLVGGTAASALMDTPLGITRLRGKRHILTIPGSETTIPAYAVYHPSYLLRQPAHKRYAWHDWLQIKRELLGNP